MDAPELSRPIDARQSDGRTVEVTASEAERAALAARFGLVRVDSLSASVTFSAEGDTVDATGRLEARIVQACAVSGEDLPVTVSEPLALRFVPEGSLPPPTDEEIELDADAPDEIEYAGERFDVGEAVAQSLALAIDPFATGPQAEEARRKAGLLDEGATGPFAALAALKKN